jgi:hypothetical protein
MADIHPRRGTIVETREYTGVDDSTGQAIKLTHGAIEWLIHVYTTGTTSLVSRFQIKGNGGRHTDTITTSLNPLPMGLSSTGSNSPCTIYAASGETVDIHIMGII